MVTKEQLFTGEEKNMIVYHYCSLESLNSILKNRSLRLTNILKSNDSMEISWICRYYDVEFKRAYENASDLFRSKISSERLMGYVKLFTDEFFNENHADFRYYVTCFSYQNDLLSQWRGYADDGRGAAIGFDLDVLKEVVTVSPEISKPSIVSLHKISYSETEQREVVHQIVHELVDEIEKILQKEEQCRESIPIRRLFIKLLQHFRMNIIRIKPTVKINANRFVIFHKGERQIWICRRISFLCICCNFA